LIIYEDADGNPGNPEKKYLGLLGTGCIGEFTANITR
jgi:hypothetical protein